MKELDYHTTKESIITKLIRFFSPIDYNHYKVPIKRDDYIVFDNLYWELHYSYEDEKDTR